ncbi:MAG: CHAT domain-containing protein [Bacteroidales bacterium]|nr:CHAT domain-containing protein [Bacteroidales bacterium]
MKQSPACHFLCMLLLASLFSFPGSAQERMEEDPQVAELIFDISNKAYDYFKININLDSAEIFYKKAIELAHSSNTYNIDYRVANNYISLASLYRDIYNNSTALTYLDEAEKILRQNDPNHRYFGTIYHNKGNIYKVQNDLYRTKEYYEYALDFLIRNGYQNSIDFTFVYSNYVELLFELEEYELAEEKLSMIDLKKLNINPVIEFRLHTTKASLYSLLNNYDLAQKHFEEALKIFKHPSTLKEHIRDVINYFYDVIGFHMLYEEYDLALEECDNAYIFIETLDPHAIKSKIIYQSDISYRSATIHYRLGNLEKALWIVNSSIEVLNTFLSRFSIEGSSNARSNELATGLPELHVLRSRILFEQFQRSRNFEDLLRSYEAYQKAIETLNYMKLAMSDEDSRLFATSQILEVYREAVYTGKMLYDLTGETSYLEQSFMFAETSKSFALYSEIKDVEAIQFADLPEEVRQKENRFMGEIQAYEELLYKEQIKSDPDSSLIEFFKETLFHLKDDYDYLKQDIEEKYANYYELKYNPRFVSLKDVQDKLSYRDALIEYVLSDTLLITYVVDRKGIHVFSQEIGPEFDTECLEYYALLNNQNFSGGVHDNYRRFVNLGSKFYKILIEPCLEYTDRENFTIVPDGAITYIPFEGLITRATDTEHINYMDLPYMIRDFSVGYSHSSTLLFSKRFKSKSPEEKVLAFAPKYENSLNTMDTAQFRQISENSEFLFPLVGTIKEVQSIHETVPSKVFINEQATEANFKKYAADYNVLHLATHTIMKDDAPLYSLLAFTNAKSADSTEDNRLYAYEIYNMKLNAQMAVLSSCNSGFGKMQKGEGMMSLARGFIYAGCPSIIMTLWQVADKSSSELMTSFYKYLKRGKSKQEAMRHAKIDYLELADDLTSNPYFWSGFVVLGDGSPIYRKSGFAYWMILITLFAGVLIFLQYRKSRARL